MTNVPTCMYNIPNLMLIGHLFALLTYSINYLYFIYREMCNNEENETTLK